MAEVPAEFLVHRAEVQPYVGTDAYGTDVYGDTVTLPCLYQASKRFIREPNGTEKVIHSVSLIAGLNTAPPVDSIVTVGETRHSVTSVAHRDDGGMGAWQHDEVLLS